MVKSSIHFTTKLNNNMSEVNGHAGLEGTSSSRAGPQPPVPRQPPVPPEGPGDEDSTTSDDPGPTSSQSTAFFSDSSLEYIAELGEEWRRLKKIQLKWKLKAERAFNKFARASKGIKKETRKRLKARTKATKTSRTSQNKSKANRFSKKRSTKRRKLKVGRRPY